MKTNLILIGMPGAGKSTVGVLAAKALCKHFVDTDLLLQASVGMKLQEFINRDGREAFARAEEAVLSGLAAENTVIATGGSAVYYPDAMARLGEIGRIVYLRISYDGMVRRLGDYSARGILLPEGMTLADMYRERTALYERYAEYTVDCDGASAAENCTALCRAVAP